MKLYFAPGACSLSPHIVAQELGLPLELVKVDTKTKRTASGEDFLAINPKGYVPVLALDNGEVLTEGPAIVQYLADRKPGTLLPPPDAFARYRVQEMLGYVNSEIHKAYSPLFNPAVPDATRADRIAHLRKHYGLLDQQLAKQPYLTGGQLTVADVYLFVVTSWAKYVKLDLSEFAHVAAFQARIAERPAVRAALAAEGASPKT